MVLDVEGHFKSVELDQELLELKVLLEDLEVHAFDPIDYGINEASSLLARSHFDCLNEFCKFRYFLE